MGRELRPHQRDAVEATQEAWDRGMTRPAIVLPTGLGKTDVIAKLATDEALAGGRPLLIAHRSELLDQMTARCQMYAPDVPVGRVQAARNQRTRPITVAMAPTLANERRRRALEVPSMVIVDECHHAASKSYMDILSWAGSFAYTRTLGVTATMARGDRRGLGDVWQEVVYSRELKWAVEHGWLVRPKGRVVVADHVKLNEAKISKGDYQDGELGEMVAQDVDQIVKAWQQHASDRITVAFTPSVAAAEALAAEFRAQGIPTGEVYGHTPLAERGDAAKGTGIYGALARGELRVLVSVMVTTEGWDCPPVSCVLWARPTKLPGLYQQGVGRGLRTLDPLVFPGHPPKLDCLVLDVVGASRTQKLVTLKDLSPTVEYDAQELESLPCEVCGGFTDGFQVPDCVCERETGERDPDGGRRRLLGPAQYEDVDLFAESQLNWLFTHAGVRFLPVGQRIAVLWPDSGDPGDGDTTYSVGHVNTRGRLDGQWFAEGLVLDKARRLGESYALDVEPSMATRAAPWRAGSRPPSEAQVSYARGLGIRDPETMSKARLSDEISIALASRVLDRVV